jgi:hypothetical protein
MNYRKKVITIFLCLLFAININAQTVIIQDSVKLEQSFKSKLRFYLGLGFTNLEQIVNGPGTLFNKDGSILKGNWKNGTYIKNNLPKTLSNLN